MNQWADPPCQHNLMNTKPSLATWYVHPATANFLPHLISYLDNFHCLGNTRVLDSNPF
jgi:hypothetical protein